MKRTVIFCLAHLLLVAQDVEADGEVVRLDGKHLQCVFDNIEHFLGSPGPDPLVMVSARCRNRDAGLTPTAGSRGLRTVPMLPESGDADASSEVSDVWIVTRTQLGCLHERYRRGVYENSLMSGSVVELDLSEC